MTIEVTLSCSPAPREVFEQVLSLPSGATLVDAVKASDLSLRFPDLDWRHALTPGIWGKAVEWGQALKDGDRAGSASSARARGEPACSPTAERAARPVTDGVAAATCSRC
jgi:putative ubiquitin-RnfH superfamily antitoxin RatB of RatAB toxin-antitoxin module